MCKRGSVSVSLCLAYEPSSVTILARAQIGPFCRKDYWLPELTRVYETARDVLSLARAASNSSSSKQAMANARYLINRLKNRLQNGLLVLHHGLLHVWLLHVWLLHVLHHGLLQVRLFHILHLLHLLENRQARSTVRSTEVR